jgi:hypothetical protein
LAGQPVRPSHGDAARRPGALGRAQSDGLLPEETWTSFRVDDAVELIVRPAQSLAGRHVQCRTRHAETPIADLAALIVRTVDKRLEIETGPYTVGSPRQRPDVLLVIAAMRYAPSVTLTAGCAGGTRGAIVMFLPARLRRRLLAIAARD